MVFQEVLLGLMASLPSGCLVRVDLYHDSWGTAVPFPHGTCLRGWRNGFLCWRKQGNKELQQAILRITINCAAQFTSLRFLFESTHLPLVYCHHTILPFLMITHTHQSLYHIALSLTCFKAILVVSSCYQLLVLSQVLRHLLF